MELKDFDAKRFTREDDAYVYVREDDYNALFNFALDQKTHIKCLQEELENTKTESVQAIQEQNERLTETIKQIDMALDACFGIKHDDFQNHIDMIDALQGYVKIKLPQEPIGVAEYLISTGCNVSGLRQIAEHLLVYCNAHKEEE